MLSALKAEGIAFAIASNKYQEGTEALAERFFGEYGFIRILGQREGVPVKPDPTIIMEAMEAVPGITRAQVVYCGDSDVDMQTGMNAGVRTIGAAWGFRTREELSAYSPWILAETAEEITAAILRDSE
jgi:phosphoglycolate phosphatase